LEIYYYLRMIRNSFYYRLLLIIIIACILPSLACNFPFQANHSRPNIDLQQTLTALAPLNPDSGIPAAEIGDPSLPLPVGATPTAEPLLIEGQIPGPPTLANDGGSFVYLSMQGDTSQAVAKRFGVEPGQIISPVVLPENTMLPAGQTLVIPNELGEIRFAEILFPDSEVVNSPTARDFNVEEYINLAGGYLSEHQEQVNGSWMSGAAIMTKVSLENSINPQLLLAILEMRSGWVFGGRGGNQQVDYPIGFYVPDYQGLYYELVLTATHLGVGYYGWRSGDKVSLIFQDGSWLRLAPGLNAGTAALQTFFSKISTGEEWQRSLYGEDGIVEQYTRMFGEPWLKSAQSGALLPEGLSQPALNLPFATGERWSFTGGPHRSWNAGSPRGALDFSPITGEPVCTTSRAWVTASAQGIITRARDNVVAIDLDGDGHEQTGWVLVYLHIVTQEETLEGKNIAADDLLGHPSCERGNSTGTHIHLARKYNGEWIPAGDPLPFILSGWQSQMGEKNYQGTLQKGDQVITANPGGPSSSLIVRED
jgi:LasA protease